MSEILVPVNPDPFGPTVAGDLPRGLIAVALLLAMVVGVKALPHPTACYGTGQHLRQQLSFNP